MRVEEMEDGDLVPDVELVREAYAEVAYVEVGHEVEAFQEDGVGENAVVAEDQEYDMGDVHE